MRLAASETDNISVDNGSSLFCFFVSGMVAGTGFFFEDTGVADMISTDFGDSIRLTLRAARCLAIFFLCRL